MDRMPVFSHLVPILTVASADRQYKPPDVRINRPSDEFITQSGSPPAETLDILKQKQAIHLLWPILFPNLYKT